MNYTLSNATLKELARGTRMEIAIPLAHPDDSPGATANLLLLPDWVDVASQRAEVVQVVPAPKAPGIHGYLGHICRDSPTESLVICVHVVIVQLYDNRRTKWGSVYPPRWPGGLEFEDGRSL